MDVRKFENRKINLAWLVLSDRIALCWGAGVWILLTFLTDAKEAWDSDLYWMVGLPVLLMGGGVVGYIAPTAKAWRIGLAIAIGHAAAIILLGIYQGNGYGLLPFTLALLALFSIPCMLSARLGQLIAVITTPKV